MDSRRCLPWGALFGFLFLLAGSSLRAEPRISGTYRCATVDISGRSGRCSAPPLVLHPDGSYQIWGEFGTYTIQGRWLILSRSKKRGPGRLIRGREIVFEYTYRGKKYKVVFQRKKIPARGMLLI